MRVARFFDAVRTSGALVEDGCASRAPERELPLRPCSHGFRWLSFSGGPRNAYALPRPVRAGQKSGQVIWVSLSAATAAEIEAQCNRR